jgi:hypothetical protein
MQYSLEATDIFHLVSSGAWLKKSVIFSLICNCSFAVSSMALRKKDAETIRLEIHRKINQDGELTILSLDEIQELIN